MWCTMHPVVRHVVQHVLQTGGVPIWCNHMGNDMVQHMEHNSALAVFGLLQILHELYVAFDIS